MGVINEGYNFKVNQGEAFKRFIKVYSQNPITKKCRPTNLEGYKAKMQIKKDAQSGVILEADTSIYDNRITISLSRAQMTSIKTTGKEWQDYEKYVYDLILDNGNKLYRLMNGLFLVSPMVTKA